MKKVIIILFFISLGVIFGKQDEEILIPDQAIRFRVIANSNSVEDQSQKLKVKEQVEKEVYQLIQGANNVSDVRSLIEENMDTIDHIVSEYQLPYQISYGNNYFPSKYYKGVLYPAGNYESLVITLGEGMGNNFWCVLFPPLCLIENTQEDISDVDYQLYVKKLLNGF